MQLWTVGIAHAALAARQAERAEADGWDGWYCVDSQCLSGDAYVALTLAAAATERIGLGTGVTNPLTRHPSVAASAIASVQVASAGRAVLGIGRGDSALAHIGRSPATVRVLEAHLEALQAYLRGDEVAFGDLPGGAPPVDALGLADTPPTSKLHWVTEPKVPVEVAATGPRVLEVAARLADRVLLAVGADPDRVAWAVDTVRSVNLDASIGSFVNVVSHSDRDVARKLISGGLSTFARFSVMHGEVHGPSSDEQRDVLATVHGSYDMNRHTRAGSAQATALTPAFIDRFGIVGTPDECIDRLHALAANGIDRFIIVGPTAGASQDAAAEAYRLFTSEVLPALAAT